MVKDSIVKPHPWRNFDWGLCRHIHTQSLLLSLTEPRHILFEVWEAHCILASMSHTPPPMHFSPLFFYSFFRRQNVDFLASDQENRSFRTRHWQRTNFQSQEYKKTHWQNIFNRVQRNSMVSRGARSSSIPRLHHLFQEGSQQYTQLLSTYTTHTTSSSLVNRWYNSIPLL